MLHYLKLTKSHNGCKIVLHSYFLTKTAMTAKISKCTSKGQITLPKDWRDQFKTDDFMIQYDQKQLIIQPINISKLQEEIIFDADRDNDGKGIPIDDLIKTLKKIKNG